jgi:hypothetical protein
MLAGVWKRIRGLKGCFTHQKTIKTQTGGEVLGSAHATCMCKLAAAEGLFALFFAVAFSLSFLSCTSSAALARLV